MAITCTAPDPSSTNPSAAAAQSAVASADETSALFSPNSLSAAFSAPQSHPALPKADPCAPAAGTLFVHRAQDSPALPTILSAPGDTAIPSTFRRRPCVRVRYP